MMQLTLSLRWLPKVRNASTAVILALAMCSCAASPRIESERDLGSGFRVVQMEQQSTGSFESTTHYSYLFFGDRNLGRADNPCISPSGRYAVYEAPPVGGLFLFDVESGTLDSLSKAFVGIPRSCKWSETAGTISLEFYDAHEGKSFPIHTHGP